MSINSYKPKWPRRSYLGPAAQAKHELTAARSSVKKSQTRPKLVIKTRCGLDSGRQKAKMVSIRHATPETARRRAIYLRRSRAWLQRPENQVCAVTVALLKAGEIVDILKATQVHHVRGRLNTKRVDLLLYEKLWLAVSQEGHSWVDANRDKARELGLLAAKGDWHRTDDLPEDKKKNSNL